MKVQEGGIKKLILLSSTIVITTITIVVSLFLITTENKNFEIEVKRIEKELLESRQRKIETRLKSILNEFTFDQALMKKLQLNEVKKFVHTLHVSLTNYSQKYSKNTLRSMLYAYDLNDSIHGFAFYEDGTVLWNPKNPKTQDNNILYAQDINNHFYIKKMIEVAKSLSDSPIYFTWYIPGETIISTNIAYVKYIPKLNLIVGAYRSEESINKWIKQTILEKMSTYQFWKESIFFVDFLQSYTMKESFLKPLLYLGKDEYIKNIQLKSTQNKISQDFLNKGFSGYHSHTFSHNDEQYLLYTTILPNWRWVVGLGENLEELTQIKNAQLSRAKINRDIKVLKLSVLSILIAGLFFILSKYLA